MIPTEKSKISSLTAGQGETIVQEKLLESLLNAAEDIARKGRAGKAVVNLSLNLRGPTKDVWPTPYIPMMRKFNDAFCFWPLNTVSWTELLTLTLLFTVAILRELDSLDTVLVASSNNFGLEEEGILRYPAKFLGDGELPNLIVVGSTDGNCRRTSSSNHADWMTTYAP